MTNGFGGRLSARAHAIANRRAEKARRRMIEAVAADPVPGVTVEIAADGVALRGRRLMTRYWGSARHAADPQLQLLVARMGRDG